MTMTTNSWLTTTPTDALRIFLLDAGHPQASWLLADSLTRLWPKLTQGPGRISLPAAAGPTSRPSPLPARGRPQVRDHCVPLVLAQPCRGGGSFSCSGSPTSPLASSVWPRVMTGFHPDNPGHTPHLKVSSLVTNISKVPHSDAQVSV